MQFLLLCFLSGVQHPIQCSPCVRRTTQRYFVALLQGEREREREQKRKQAVYALLTLAFAWWMISNGLRTMLWRMNLPHSTNSKAHIPILPHSAVQRLIFTMSCRSKSAKLDARAQPWLVTQLPSSPETTGSDKARWTQLGAFFRCTTVAPPPLRNLT